MLKRKKSSTATDGMAANRWYKSEFSIGACYTASPKRCIVFVFCTATKYQLNPSLYPFLMRNFWQLFSQACVSLSFKFKSFGPLQLKNTKDACKNSRFYLFLQRQSFRTTQKAPICFFVSRLSTPLVSFQFSDKFCLQLQICVCHVGLCFVLLSHPQYIFITTVNDDFCGMKLLKATF